MSVHVFCSFLDWIICSLGVELYQFFILDTNPLLDLSFASIFSHSVGFLLVVLIVSFTVQKFVFWCSPKSLFLLLFPFSEETYLEKCCFGRCLRHYQYLCSLPGFIWFQVSQLGLSSLLSLFLCMVKESGPLSFFYM